MNRAYSDITSRLGEPLWWDDQCVPRYCIFAPEACGIYDKVVALVVIACQDCHREFRVAVALNEEVPPDPTDRSSVSTYVEFGDPPNHDDDGAGKVCWAGRTMNAVPLRVLEWWARDGDAWTRRTEFEGAVDCDWMRGP